MKLKMGYLRVQDWDLFIFFFFVNFALMVLLSAMNFLCWIFKQDCSFLFDIPLNLMKEQASFYTLSTIGVNYVFMQVVFKCFPATGSKPWLISYANAANKFITSFCAVLLGVTSGPISVFLIIYVVSLCVPAFSIPGLSTLLLIAIPAIFLFFIVFFAVTCIFNRAIGFEK